MVNTLPAVLIGGPPHAGKSVLFYSLTHALRQRGIRHHAIRACPDGEGNWTQESDAETVSQIRIKIEGDWPDDYVKRICLDLEHRCLPLLVDVGGKPKESQMCILRQCTHSLLPHQPGGGPRCLHHSWPVYPAIRLCRYMARAHSGCMEQWRPIQNRKLFTSSTPGYHSGGFVPFLFPSLQTAHIVQSNFQKCLSSPVLTRT